LTAITALEQLAAIVIDAASPMEEVERACARLYDLFRDAAAPSMEAAAGATEEQRLESGLALSPALAANCLLDARRTRAFVRGTIGAIREAAARVDREHVEVLYAGTGPFAPLAFLALPFLDRERVRFTLLDIHPQSACSVEALVETFGFSDSVRAVICDDATVYRHPVELHVVVTETMQRALAEEPFVAIVRNLRPQLSPDGVLVPAHVTIDLASIDPAAEQARWRGEAVESSAHYIHGRVYEMNDGLELPPEGEATTIVVRRDPSSEPQWLALICRVVVHADEVLEPYESGLTTPEILWNVPALPDEAKLAFRYVTGSRPRIEYRVQDDFRADD
jgi:predicted RNA methylase